MLSSLLSRQLAAEPTYDRFATIMDYWGYTWEPLKVFTDDGYILTSFHVTGKVGEEPVVPTETLGSVVIQHGLNEDAARWITTYGENKPFHLQLVDSGYDVWLGNNRGTEYSQGHLTLTPEEPEYWDFDWSDMGMYDQPAQIKAIKEATGQQKIQYIGYSQGTAQMHYALAHDDNDFFGESLQRVIQLAPCFVPDFPNIITNLVSDGIMKFQEHDVYALYDREWDEVIDRICDNSDFIQCEVLKNMGNGGAQPGSVKALQYWMQLGLTDGFYEPVTMEQWANGDRIGAEIDVSKINSVPMTFIMGGSDSLCRPEFAMEYAAKIPIEIESIEIDWKGHQYFASEAHTEYFMSHLLEQLKLHW